MNPFPVHYLQLKCDQARQFLKDIDMFVPYDTWMAKSSPQWSLGELQQRYNLFLDAHVR